MHSNYCLVNFCEWNPFISIEINSIWILREGEYFPRRFRNRFKLVGLKVSSVLAVLYTSPLVTVNLFVLENCLVTIFFFILLANNMLNKLQILASWQKLALKKKTVAELCKYHINNAMCYIMNCILTHLQRNNKKKVMNLRS